MTDQEYDVAILGAGPAGLSAAARAVQRSLTHVVLEAAAAHANTIQRYQRRKHVMAEPGVLPLRSDLDFRAGRRESVLDAWDHSIRERGLNIRYGSEVTAVSGARGAFHIALRCGLRVRARNVVLAMGVQGNPRRLEIPGGDLPGVQAFLDDPDEYRDETIVIVGAGDAAIENALALAHHNRVILLNRRAAFTRAKEGNVARVTRALEARQLECRFEAEPVRVEKAEPGAPHPWRVVIRDTKGEHALDCHRVIARLGAVPPRQFVESAGVRFADVETDALPELTPRYETTQPGLYIIGSLAGSSLIKQAMNQGYEVIEHLSGNDVTPADHAILEQRLGPILTGRSVDETLEALHRQLPTFAGLSAQALREVVLGSRVVTLRGGAAVFSRGDYPASVYHVIHGHTRLEVTEGLPMTLRAGQIFGETGLLSGRPHEISAIAHGDCVLLQTPHSVLRKAMRAEPAVRAYIDRVFMLRALRLFFLPNAHPQTIHDLAECAQIHAFKAGTTLFSQNDAIDRHHFLRRGSVTLSREAAGQHTPVAFCAAGSFVDVAACSPGSSVRTVTARAEVDIETLSVDHESLMRLLTTDETLLNKVREDQKRQLTGHARLSAQPDAGQILSFLMSNGVCEATNVLVIDEQLCIGCDQCEKACATTHEGVSRLNRRAGPSFNSLHLPTSCRHCEHPHCMRDCPPNAIHRLPDGEVFIDDTCIGCGNCEENCPYGVIQMAEIPSKQSLLGRLLGKRPEDPPKTAVKCDMCKDLSGGPACVKACPTGAALRIGNDDVVTLARARAAARR
jgi:thioredoxin reductase/Fe-S-cluster-containing hydrogenase component 2/CRP-like cAMP-binding protein